MTCLNGSFGFYSQHLLYMSDQPQNEISNHRRAAPHTWMIVDKSMEKLAREMMASDPYTWKNIHLRVPKFLESEEKKDPK